MAKLDPYLRSIEKFSATGAILVSGQAIVLRFPTGDRAATQVTGHDQLVAIVREVAPPSTLDQIDAGRPSRFDVDSGGTRYSISVVPRPGLWQVTIEASDDAAPGPAGDMDIERGQYDAPSAGITTVAPASGSAVLDQLTRAARGARANDVFLSAGIAPLQRVAGELSQVGGPLDAEAISRELGVIAPASARAAWTEGDGYAVFAYGDGLGRVRVTLGRDRRGPCAALHLLPEEAPGLDRLNLAQAAAWLDGSGLVLVAGPAGAGKTVVLAAMTRSLDDKQRRVVAIEHPIEIVQTGEGVSQREVGTHVPSTAAGITAAMAEGADAIVVGDVTGAETAQAIVTAVAGGHLVVAAVPASSAAAALDRLVGQLHTEARDDARGVLRQALVGVVCPSVTREGRRYEVIAGTPR